MAVGDDAPAPGEQWAHFRFSIVGPLLASPPEPGQLKAELERLAARSWRHPRTGQWVQIGRSTIERWYYRALREKRDPVRALARKVRTDRGRWPALSAPLRQALSSQYHAHPDWSCRLHADNLAVVVKSDPHLGTMPSYRTVVRWLKAHGLVKRRRLGPPASPGAQLAEQRLEQREVRSYESAYTNALWHLDYHHGSVRVLMPDGKWVYPLLLGILDDHSRLACHAQWYRAETAENLVHGLTQAILKRGLPRALMSDNGSAMTAAETTQGLGRLGIVHQTTLPYSPWQNGKQESFWGQVEGRLLAMIADTPDLTLGLLNQATQAWIEMEYNRKVHAETQRSPLQCFLDDTNVSRPAPTTEQLRLAFTAHATRIQRRTDGTVSLFGRRFEVPAAYAHVTRIHLRAATWDLAHVHLCDPHSGDVLTRLYPLDKHRNAEGRRRTKQPPPDTPRPVAHEPDMAPLLRKLIADYAATGLAPAYIPKDERKEID